MAHGRPFQLITGLSQLLGRFQQSLRLYLRAPICGAFQCFEELSIRMSDQSYEPLWIVPGSAESNSSADLC